jgi:hypothetical protein
MTQALNLANFANNLNTSGQANGATAIYGTVPTATTATNVSGGTATVTQLTIGSTQLGAGNASSFKNRIINGQFQISQYNGSSSTTPTSSTYVIDRWRLIVSASSKLSVQQNAGSVTPPVGFPNYLGLTSLAATTVAAGDEYVLYQKIEGFNTSDLAWGTANAKTITLSFQVYSSLTGTFGGAINNSDQSRSYPFSYTITTANTWTPISVTVAGDTTGTWVGATNGTGMVVRFGLGVGSTYSGTAGSWSGNAYDSTTGATSVVGTNGATFYITGVQLEVGTNATSFDYRPYGTELALCQRYFVGFPASSIFFGYSFTTTDAVYTTPLSVSMRTTPTLTSVPASIDCRNGGNGGTTPSAVTLSTASNYILAISSASTGFTTGQGSRISLNAANAVTLSAEL